MHKGSSPYPVVSLPGFALPPWARWAMLLALWTLPGLTALSYYYLDQVVTARPITWPYALVSTLPNWYIWAAFTPLILWLARRFPTTRETWGRNVLAIHLPVMLLLLLVHSLLNLALYRAMGLHDTVSMELYRVHFTTRMHANILTYWTVLGFYLAYDYFRKFELQERQAALLELQLAQANLRALRMQLNPHFLFNTLHSVSALVRKKENRHAVRMLGRLGAFLRLALENKGVQEITLRDELEFLERYLEIEKIRFQERLTVATYVDADTLDALVPNLLLQPLAENAIHHAIAPRSGAGRIEIHAARRNGRLVLEVRDDGPGIREPHTARRGVGLSNTAERLERLYGDEQVLDLRNGAQGGLTVYVELPHHTEPIVAAYA